MAFLSERLWDGREVIIGWTRNQEKSVDISDTSSLPNHDSLPEVPAGPFQSCSSRTSRDDGDWASISETGGLLTQDGLVSGGDAEKKERTFK